MNNLNCNSSIKALAIVIIINGLVASCSSVPAGKQEILKEAREAYNQAQLHPNTANLDEFSEAKQALEKAERAETPKEMQHLAYIAEQQAKTALTIAKRQSIGILQEQPRFIKADRKGKNPRLQQRLVTWYKHKIGRLKTTLQAQTWLDIETIAAFLNQHPELKISVEGHTDNNGTHQYNLGLSKRHATSVKFELMQRGVASNRIHVKSFGETRPIASNNTKAERQKNWRVELFLW